MQGHKVLLASLNDRFSPLSADRRASGFERFAAPPPVMMAEV